MTKTKCVLFILSISLLMNAEIALAANCDERHPALGRWELVHILRRDGFSLVIDEYTELIKVGNIRVADSCFTIFVYSEEFEAASNMHETTRLLIIRNLKYLGMYSIDELPIRIKGNTVEFPGKKEYGSSIVFSDEEPPEKIYLDGEVRRLFK